MKRFIFESRIPSLLNPAELATRAGVWLHAGFDTAVLQVDDGRGCTWPTAAWAADPRSVNGDIRRVVDYLHGRGLRVIADIAVANFLEAQSPHPHLKLGSFAYPLYNFWSAEFRSRRIQCVVDLANECDVDAVALDYLRTGREAIGAEQSAAALLTAWVHELRAAVPASMPLVGVHAEPFAVSIQQGIDLRTWLSDGTLDGSMLFDYRPTYPVDRVKLLADYVGAAKVWPLIGNYDERVTPISASTGLAVAKNIRQVQRRARPGAIGVYVANLLTADQADHLRYSALALD